MNRVFGYCLVFLIVLDACSPSLQNSTSNNNYYEDLSRYRVVYTPKADTIVQEEVVEKTAFNPTLDITENLDAKLDSLAKNAQSKTKSIFGFSIQVYSGGSEESANYSKGKLMTILPEEKVKLTYEIPNYRVRVGAYFSPFEAHYTLKKLKNDFPTAIVVRRRIYF